MKYQLNWHYGTAHFTLSKFKKAGQLAFLTGFIFVLSSCGGGGGGDRPVDITETTPAGFSYSSISDWISTITKFSNDCETENANCTEAQARSILEALITSSSVENAEFQIYYTATDGGYCRRTRNDSSYSYAIQGSSLFETIKFNPSQCGSVNYPGMEITVDAFSYLTFEYDFPGALSGLLSLNYGRIGFTDSSLNETVYKGIHIRPIENSGLFWTGTEYSWVEISEFDYGNTCNYSGDPRYCSSITLDNNGSVSIVGSTWGFKTFSGDMPTSGSYSYRTNAVSKGIYEKDSLDFLYQGNSLQAFINSGCGSNNPSHRSCHWRTSDAVSSEQFLSVNFSSNTLTGSISLTNHYYESSYTNLTLLTASEYDQHKSTLNNLSISATISSNSFTGTVSNSHFTGNIYGNFYGPTAREIAAIILIDSANAPSTGYYANEIASSVIVVSGKR